jgi:3-hydroxyacyl-CoA dehydrogenase
MQQVLALIHPTDKFTDLKGCDLIIETVFEDK